MSTPQSGRERRAISLFRRDIVTRALIDSLIKLDPRVQLRNPVMFVVEIGAVITTITWFIQIGGGTFKRIPVWLALLEISLVGWWTLAVVAVLVYVPFWLLAGLSKKRRRPAERAIRFWPLITVLSLIAIVVIFLLASEDFISRMGNPTPWSVSLFVATLAYGLAALVSIFVLWRMPKAEIRKGVRWFSIAVIVPLFISALYLAYWGIVGLRTWA